MAINERLVHTASAAAGTGNQEEGLILHLDANDVDSYDGDGDVWYDIHDHEYAPTTNVSEHFNTVTYTGTSAINSITGVGFQPDLVWLKQRNSTQNHGLWDSLRGANNFIMSNSNSAQNTRTTDTLSSFDSDGFTVTGYTSDAFINYTGRNMVAWCFKAGGTPTASTPYMIDGTGYATLSEAGLADDGDLDLHEASINTKLGFAIYRFDPNTTSGETVSFEHGLGTTPELVITKSASDVYNWWTFTNQIDGSWDYLKLNGQDAKANVTSISGDFADATTMRISYGFTGISSDHVAYAFISKRGVSKVGSYIGDGTTNNKIYTGFEPAFIIIKRTDSTSNWRMYDNARGTQREIYANSNAYEPTADVSYITFDRDGFTLTSNGDWINNSGGKFIYYAVAKNTNETELSTTSSGVWSGFQNAVTSITSDSTATTNAPGTADTATTHSIFDTANSFSMGNNGTTEADNEIFITLNAPKSIRGFAVYEMYQSTYKYTGTTKLYGSTDNSNWYLLGSTVQTTSIQYNRNETTFAATPEYQYYKFTLSANTRGTYQGAWAFELIADFDVTPSLHLDPASYSGSGTTWTADTGSDGTLVGDTSYDQELGDFFDLDGSGDYISLNSSGYLTGDFTVEMWWNFDTLSGFKMLWGGQGYDGGNGLGHYINGNTLHTYISVSGATSSPTGQSGAVLTAGKWHHIVITRSGDTYTQYVDGTNVGSGTGSTASLESANTYIGAHYNNTAYNVDGRVGQVRVYNAALSEEAIRKNINFTKNDYPNEIHGTINNSTFLPGTSGEVDAFDFNGSNSSVSLDSSSFSQNTYTIAAWFKLDALDLGGIFEWGDAASYERRGLIVWDGGSGNYKLYSSTYASNVPANTTLAANNWYHGAVTMDNGSASLYLNGQPDGTGTNTLASYTGTTGYVGRTQVGEYLDGKVSEVKVYNRVLTASEIEALYNEGNG